MTIRTVSAAAAAAVLLTACGKSTFEFNAGDTYSEGNFVNAEENSSASGTMRLEENRVVVISPDFKKGEVNVIFKDRTGNIELNEAVSGRVMDAYELEAGEYDVSVTAMKKTTGKLVIASIDKDEYEQQTFDLYGALNEAGALTN